MAYIPFSEVCPTHVSWYGCAKPRKQHRTRSPISNPPSSVLSSFNYINHPLAYQLLYTDRRSTTSSSFSHARKPFSLPFLSQPIIFMFLILSSTTSLKSTILKWVCRATTRVRAWTWCYPLMQNQDLNGLLSSTIGLSMQFLIWVVQTVKRKSDNFTNKDEILLVWHRFCRVNMCSAFLYEQRQHLRAWWGWWAFLDWLFTTSRATYRQANLFTYHVSTNSWYFIVSGNSSRDLIDGKSNIFMFLECSCRRTRQSIDFLEQQCWVFCLIYQFFCRNIVSGRVNVNLSLQIPILKTAATIT